ncbi:uncharacterized protein [Periplaneta americana]|uniref:uncharacterized protein isoform X5 n=1 Tax=Periplaneta americana TaxID=6978 RepID=UPI0037E72165
MSYYSEENLDQGHALTHEVKVEKDPMLISFPMMKNEPEERNSLDQLVTGSKEEYQDQSHDLTSEIKVEDPVPISFPVVKREPEERNFLDHHVTAIKEEYVKQSHDLVSEQERNFLDHHVTGIKEEFVNQSHDLLSEVKCEKDPVAISFPVVKREPEEEQSDSDAVNEEPRVEVTAEDNEVLTERIANRNERTGSTELASLPLEENEVPKKSVFSRKPERTREDEKQLEL